jgi:hypothetical protein
MVRKLEFEELLEIKEEDKKKIPTNLVKEEELRASLPLEALTGQEVKGAWLEASVEKTKIQHYTKPVEPVFVRKFTEKEKIIIESLAHTHDIDMLADRLMIDRKTCKEMFMGDTEALARFRRGRQEGFNLATNKLWEKINTGDFNSIKFYLERRHNWSEAHQKAKLLLENADIPKITIEFGGGKKESEEDEI